MKIEGTNYRFEIVAILNGENESDVIQQINGETLVGISTPATVDGTELQFKMSESKSGIFKDYYTADGAQVTITMAASRWIGLEGTDFSGAVFFKLVSVTPTAADREFILMFKGYGGA